MPRLLMRWVCVCELLPLCPLCLCAICVAIALSLLSNIYALTQTFPPICESASEHERVAKDERRYFNNSPRLLSPRATQEHRNDVPALRTTRSARRARDSSRSSTLSVDPALLRCTIYNFSLSPRRFSFDVQKHSDHRSTSPSNMGEGRATRSAT